MPTFTYENGRYYRDDKPFFVIASDYMYFRDRRDHWRDRLEKLRAADVNCITTYIPWRHHLRLDGETISYDFTGQTKDSRDVVTFLETVAELGFYLILKPGPFVHSELNVGGLPDLVCPSKNPEQPPARRHHGRPAIWTYDASQLPAPFDTTLDDRVREWFAAVRDVIVRFHSDDGPLIGIQLVDETIYCTSNDAPWHIGYEPSGVRYFHGLLRDRYEDLDTYNRLHGTDYPTLEMVPGPRLLPLDGSSRAAENVPTAPADVLQYVDWADYQWRYRRDLYERYKNYLDVDVPYLTNYAGITPPIEENVPDLQDEAVEDLPEDFRRLYSEWWFAMNRVDTDVDVHEYGMISWLGVAAYDRAVFDRFINTARRARGINMEENWGFAKLYDVRSRCAMIPVFQTLVSVAGGATGYDIFTGVSSDHWDETLDRITKLQHPTFPSDAPIDEHGNLRSLYYAAERLNRFFAAHGEDLLHCEQDTDCAYLLYAPYAAVSSWIPDDRYWKITDHEIPRCGHQGFEEFAASCQDAGYSVAMFELEAATPARFAACRALAIHSAFFMGRSEQQKLADFIASGGRLFISGELPTLDENLEPCDVLKLAVEATTGAGQGGANETGVTYRPENLFAAGNFPDTLAAAGITPAVTYSPDMRAYFHRRTDTNQRDGFLFFFNFDNHGPVEKWIEIDGRRLDLTLGSKTCGVVRIDDDRITAHYVKGENEVEDAKDDIRIALGDQRIEGVGDFCSSDGST